MTDFEKIYNVFKDIGIGMLVKKDRTCISLLENACKDAESYFVGDWEFIDGKVCVDGYIDHHCDFSFDENGKCTECNIVEY